MADMESVLVYSYSGDDEHDVSSDGHGVSNCP